MPVVPLDPQSFADRPGVADFDDVPDRAVLLDVRAAVVRESVAHPNVVRATDAGEARGLNYLVMEYIEGVDAARLLRQHGPLAVADACA